MTRQFVTKMSDEYCLVQKWPSMELPQLYVAVNHDGHPELCDACHLQADCHEINGPQGRDCKIHRQGRRWHSLDLNKANEFVSTPEGQ